MNCSRFRFLIQQWFDSAMSPQDERQVMAHLESCDSCSRFQHQLEQVIQSAPEVPLPDECLPSNLEALAKRIMVETPQEKPGFLSKIKGLFSGIGGGKPKKEKPQQAAVGEEPPITGGSMFPHRKKQLEDVQPGQARGKRNLEAEQDMLATSTRLKSLQKLHPNNPVDDQSQTQGLSLGSKFGMAVPERSDSGDETPLTLAESIRRKVSEDTRPREDEMGDPDMAPGPQGFGAPNQAFAPPGFGQEQQGFGQPGFGQTPGYGQQPPAQPGFGQQPPAQGMVGQWGESSSAPAPQPNNWADPPRPGVGGDSDWKPTPPAADWQIAKPQTSAWGGAAPEVPEALSQESSANWGSAWPGDAIEEDPASQRRAQPADPNQGWGNTAGGAPSGAPQAPAANAGWGGMPQAPSAPVPQAQGWGEVPQPNVPANDGWGAPPAPQNAAAGSGWGAPPAPPVSNDAWGAPPAPAASNDAWGAPPAPAASNDAWGAPPAPAASNDAWGAPPAPAVSNDAWGAPPAPAASNDAWGAPPAPAASNDAWGAPPAPAASSDAWGAPPTPAVSNDAWGAPPAPAASNDAWGAPPTPAVSNDAWGAPPAPAVSNDAWGAPPAPAASNDGWGAPPAPAASNDAWGAPPAPAATNDGWGAPPVPAATNDAWGAPPAPAANAGWSGGAPSQAWGGAAPATAGPASAGWGQQQQPAPDGTVSGGWSSATQSDNAGWGADQSQNNASNNPYISAAPAPESAPPKPVVDNFDAWSEEGEQIQTGMWQAFTLDEPAIGAPKTGQPQARQSVQLPKPGGGQPAGDANRWDTPIQQRPAEQVSAVSDPSLYDVPIQERMKMQQQAAAQPPAPPAPPAVPAPPVVPPVPMQPTPSYPSAAPAPHGSSLGDDLAAMAAGGQAAGGWSATPPMPPPVPPVPTPAPPPPVPTPAPPAMPPAPSAAASAPAMDASQYDIPIQERMKQAAPPTPVAAAAGSASGGMFKVDDSTMDKIFSENLGVTDPVKPINQPVAAAPAPQMVPPVPPVPPTPLQGGGRLAAPPPVPSQPVPAAGPRISAVPPRPGVPQMPEAPVQPAPAPAPVPVAPQPAVAAKDDGLMRLDDNAMDKIFSSLGVPVEQHAQQQANAAPPAAPAPSVAPPPPPLPNAGRPAPPPVPAAMPPAPPVPPMPVMPAATAPGPASGGWNAPVQPAQPVAPVPVAAAARPAGNGLFNVDDDAMDRIFSDLGVQATAAPKINVREAVQQIRTLADVPAPPKVEGVGRLSREVESNEAVAPGKINAIGKFLLDQQDLAKINNLTQQDLSDTKIRVLTHEAADEISKLLEHIATQPGVVGSVIVGHDGILIANSLPKDVDAESIGIWSMGIYVNTTNISKKMGHNHLHQLVQRTQQGYLVIADFGGGILVTVSNAHETEKLIPLMRSITQLVAQS